MTRARGVLLAGLALLAGWAGGTCPAARAAGADIESYLFVDVEPPDPWVGQAVLLRVRAACPPVLSEETAYDPPVTTGFWVEATSLPERYYAMLAGRRVLVTERRTLMFPFAPGVARIEAAKATYALSGGAVERPLWPGGPASRRDLVLRSDPVEVRVRALPAGAPAGFDGAVGTLAVTWTADRAQTSRDVPITMRMDVRGVGNLALIKTPALETPGAEVFTSTAEDSLPAAGTMGPGLRRFLWNVLPRRTGTLTIAAPTFAWFDPAAGRYRTAALPVATVEVGPPVFSSGPDRDAFPDVFRQDAPNPFGHGVRVWAWAVVGLLLGSALALWRLRRPVDPRAEERTRLASWRNALRTPGGPAFWRAAEEAVEWLEGGGRAVADLRAEVKGTRYGRGEADVEAVRRRLERELVRAMPPARSGLPVRALAVLLAVAAVVAGSLSVWDAGRAPGPRRLQSADRVAGEGDVARARVLWQGMWREGGRAPALAARLAWAELAEGGLAPATVWVLRGEQAGTRDRALGWVRDLVREGGGMAGARPVRLPVRPIEWALLALALGVAAGALWPRRGTALALALLAVAAVVVGPIEDAWVGRVSQAVVARSVELAGTGIELDAGQVVRVLGRDGGGTRVRVGRELEGVLPGEAVLPVDESR